MEREHHQQYLPLGVRCVDGLLLEKDRNVYVLQLPDEFQAVERIPGEAADRLCDALLTDSMT